jgi:uncharacterized membrane protein
MIALNRNRAPSKRLECGDKAAASFPRRTHAGFASGDDGRVTTRFRARQLAHDLRGNLLIRPALITIALTAAAIVLVEIDQRFGEARLLGSIVREPGAAQALLGAIGGSVIGVVSIVYSVLVMSLTMASMQFSPRILSAFLRDPISQNVLGVFTGTFLYCLAALRGVRTDPPFVPSLTLTGAVVLALATIAALIYFINHIAREIQINYLAARISRMTVAIVEHELPESPAVDVAVPAMPAEASGDVVAQVSGYVQLVDLAGLSDIAARVDLRVDVVAVPGDFVPAGGLLARVTPPPDEEMRAFVRRAFDLGPVRTLQQDVAFGLRQLVDIGLKAISPAVNDPSTCSTCIDHLGDLLCRIVRREAGARIVSEGAHLRLVVPSPTFKDHLDLAFNQLRQYGRGDLAVANRIMRALVQISASTADATRLAAIRLQGRLLIEGVDPRFPPEDRVELEARWATLRA